MSSIEYKNVHLNIQVNAPCWLNFLVHTTIFVDWNIPISHKNHIFDQEQVALASDSGTPSHRFLAEENM